MTDSTLSESKIIIGMSNEFAFGFIPTKVSFKINDNKLRNSITISYTYPIVTTIFPGFETCYRHSFFKKFGIFTEFGFSYFWGKFHYYNEQKLNGISYIDNASYWKFNLGYFHRFKLNKFGIIEPSLNINYYYSRDSNLNNFILPSIALTYYFKRNKPKK
jgi:hypothetical protein